MSNEPPSIKITLLGNPGVGKTCIISRYIDNVFNENNASTIGANYSEKPIVKKGKHIIWIYGTLPARKNFIHWESIFIRIHMLYA